MVNKMIKENSDLKKLFQDKINEIIRQNEENTKKAEAIRDEIKEMIKRYPKYSVELVNMMKDFDSE